MILTLYIDRGADWKRNKNRRSWGDKGVLSHMDTILHYDDNDDGDGDEDDDKIR